MEKKSEDTESASGIYEYRVEEVLLPCRCYKSSENSDIVEAGQEEPEKLPYYDKPGQLVPARGIDKWQGQVTSGICNFSMELDTGFLFELPLSREIPEFVE
ncbi:hypothetical protein PTKIN_Ptkin06aG0032000 [Pterospermum kingtungense]